MRRAVVGQPAVEIERLGPLDCGVKSFGLRQEDVVVFAWDY
jgi:hypothetical protein